MKLLVVVLNYRVTELTIACLESLEPEIHHAGGIKVAVLENGTGQEAEEKLREVIAAKGWESWVELTAISPNRGFTGGNNFLIRKALESSDPPEYFLLLNADTLVQPGALESLIRFMDGHPRAGVGGSRLEWPNGTRQASPFRFQGIASELDRGLNLGIVSRLLSRWSVCLPLPTPAEARQVDWVCGASMIIRRELIEEIGPLDEGLYTYFDDIDYCLNAKRAGWETWYVPEAGVFHLEGSSTGVTHKVVKRRPPYWFQARRRFFLRNYGAFYTALVDAAFLFGFASWRLRRIIQRKPDTDPPHMLADSLRHSVFMTGFKVCEVENPALAARELETAANRT
jgi:GT2 family glycosyltransferase